MTTRILIVESSHFQGLLCHVITASPMDGRFPAASPVSSASKSFSLFSRRGAIHRAESGLKNRISVDNQIVAVAGLEKTMPVFFSPTTSTLTNKSA